MAIRNFANCLPITLGYEGGYVDDPHDPGGATNMGITRRALANWRHVSPWYNLPKSAVKALTRAEVAPIYESEYWRKIGAEGLLFGLDLVAFDAAVNSGPAQASAWLQASPGKDAREMIQAFSAKRLGFLHRLKTFGRYGKGWVARVANVEARAVAMWLKASNSLGAATMLRAEGKDAGKASSAQSKAAGTGALGTGGGGLGLEQGGVNWWIIGALGAVALLVIALVAVKAHANNERAKAYAAVAVGA